MAELEIADIASVYDALGPQISDALPAFFGIAAKQELEMGEVFPIWFVPASEVEWNSEIEEIAAPLGRIHVQLYGNGQPYGSARADADPVTSFRLTEVFQGEFSTRVSLGTQIIDKDIKFENFVARILSIPGFNSDAVWLHSNDDDQMFPIRGVLSDGDILVSWEDYRAALMEQGSVPGIE